MNRLGDRIAACLGKAALKTHALQTLPRDPLTRPRARSVWSASDLSDLSAPFVQRGTATEERGILTQVPPSKVAVNANRAAELLLLPWCVACRRDGGNGQPRLARVTICLSGLR